LFAQLAAFHAAGISADIQPANLRCEYLGNHELRQDLRLVVFETEIAIYQRL
jgi:hypothetical protein